MEKHVRSWFFMRPGFDTFELQPETHSRYIFGKGDKRQRNHLLTSLEEAGYSHDGFKAAVFGDYGRGKTHQCYNIIFEVERRALPFFPVYIKCGAYGKKEKFTTLFREMLTRLPATVISEAALEYQRREKVGCVQKLVEVTRDEDIATVMDGGLSLPNQERVRLALRWLGGDPKADPGNFGAGLKPQLTDSGDFGAVMRGLSHILIQINGKVPLYIVDEAERLQNITDTDTFFAWLAALRELTETRGVAMLFMIGAKTRDALPVLFVQDEIIRRIGVSNYFEFLNPGKEDLREFLLEQFQTSIRKGEVPEVHREVMAPEALDVAVPPELLEITDGDPQRLATFPFAPDAFEQFVTQIASGDMANKPSEAQKRVQKAAQRAIRLNRRVIDQSIVEQLETDAF